MKTEIFHNTPEQVRETIEAALTLTEDLDPDSDLRQAVFLKAVDMLSAKQIMYEQVRPGMAIPRGR